MQKHQLLVMGVYPNSEGYPNVKYRLEQLAALPDLEVNFLHEPIWKDTISKHRQNQLLLAFRFVKAHFLLLFRYLSQSKPKQVYLPYPAVFVALMLSFLPQRCRPKSVVLDGFISLYDSICIDRAYVSTSSILAKLLHWLERRAYSHCSAVIVDSAQNANYYAVLFALPPSLFHVVPLTTYEKTHIEIVNPQAVKQPIEILFIGTLIPLHGVEVILDAIKLLANQPQLHFTFIGSGQEAPKIKAFLLQYPGSVTWITDWLSQEELHERILHADLCLGIFSENAKAQRVCPLKIYAYAACGKAIITARNDWMRSFAETEASFALVAAGSARELADRILRLANAPEQREHLTRASKDFYEKHLSNRIAMQKFLSVLFQVA